MTPRIRGLVGCEFTYQYLSVDIPFASSRGFGELGCCNQELRDRGNAVGTEQGELKSFIKGEGKFGLSGGELDLKGLVVCHVRECTAGGVPIFLAGGSYTVMAKICNEKRVEKQEKKTILCKSTFHDDTVGI